MNARTRRRQQRRNGWHHDGAFVLDQWSQAAEIRDEWLAYGLTTQPAERDTAEAAITGLYAMIGKPRPRFVWVTSPQQALAHLPEPDTPQSHPRFDEVIDAASPWYVMRALATAALGLRRSLEAGTGRPANPLEWSTREYRLAQTRPAAEALDSGAALGDLLDAGVRDALTRSVRDGIGGPLRRLLNPPHTGGPTRLCWYGQHDVHWIAQ